MVTSGRMRGYILVGGMSSRMGRPKWSLQLRGRRFVDRLIAALDPNCDEVILVGREPIDHHLRQITDADHPEPAAIHGVARALDDCDGRALIVAVDLPAVDSSTIALVSTHDDESYEIVIPMIDGAPQMLCAVYSKRLLPILRRRIRENRFSLKELAKEVRSKLLEDDRFEPHRFLNVNSPEDLRTMESLDVEAHASR